MKNTIVFDEAMSLTQILNDYEATARKCNLRDVERVSGEDVIRTMHQTLKKVAKLGNQTRMEKVIEGKVSKLKVIAISRKERGWIWKLAAIFGVKQ